MKNTLFAGCFLTVFFALVWCKEDAFQVVLDYTPGKKSLVVKPLFEVQVRNIIFKDPAGFLLVWNQSI